MKIQPAGSVEILTRQFYNPQVADIDVLIH
jgi:hypothetical protein